MDASVYHEGVVRLVEASGAVADAPDVHGITFQCPGNFYTTSYFAVSWFRGVYDEQNGREYWYPEYRVFGGLSYVAAVTGDIPVSSTPIIALPEPHQRPAPWERVSLNFFQGCSTYLMLGMSWPVADRVGNTYHELREKFVQIIPACSSSKSTGGAFDESAATTADCDDDTCVLLDDVPLDPRDRIYDDPNAAIGG